jgi:hypothetical protein
MRQCSIGDVVEVGLFEAGQSIVRTMSYGVSLDLHSAYAP